MKKLLATLCVAAALVGCQTTPNMSGLPQHPLIKKIVQPQSKTLVYFDDEWKPTQEPTAGGFYRKIYGKTAQGHYIAQDFYQDSQTKQVDPFEIINEKGLTIGDNSNNTGDVVWYTPAGKKKAFRRFNNGRYTGDTAVYHDNGNVLVRTRLLKKTGRYPYYSAEMYAPSGEKTGLVLWHGTQPEHVELYDAGEKVWSVKKASGKPFSLSNHKGKNAQSIMLRAMRLVESTRLLIPDNPTQ